ncbi:hypothetical protein IGI04_004091 [Brassica rapa subsp. trilocularis]|uniref:Phorbol-ester/DAG-type domain-containing protein n=1 Tax=Brassica rapa subsp. trilocularis TaxID=1813537 RepID=A0ABQ7P0A4_BRACM|nr:hypothetical protein IGI04_004091 [Brassica rapa subsp. trilocularis]
MDTHFWSPDHRDEVPFDDRWEIAFTAKSAIKNLNRSPFNFCGDCLEHIEDNDFPWCCSLCIKKWHLRCVPSSPDDINHPFHPYHPLELLIDVPRPPDHSKSKCDECQQELKSYFYHCSLCDFSMHVRCSKEPPPPIVETAKCHEHTLTCMVRNDTFTCNACGTHGERCPYVCAPCGVMFHWECIKLPHVININRHDHRVSHTFSLGFGKRKCMICHKKVDWRYGAYSCSTCPDDYVVHSKCATRSDVWDGVELEGVPEEYFDVLPFEVIEEGISIKHFSHEEHILYTVEDEDDMTDGSMRCEACVHPIFSEAHYKCMECHFIIHETCANLPLRKRHWLSTTPFYLNANDNDTSDSFFRCGACQTISNGFRYESDKGVSLDMRCAFVISSYSDHECHPHTLFITTLDEGNCGGCKLTKKHVLRCTECDFSLCLACATLPKKIKRKGDEHFLFLRHGEKEVSGKYWCEVCEAVLDPHEEWFYTCHVSGVTFHIKCVVGEFPNAKPGFTYRYQCVLGHNLTLYGARVCTRHHGEEIIQLVRNDRSTRPKCASCGSRCLPPLILKFYLVDTYEVYCCNLECSLKFLLDSAQDFNQYFQNWTRPAGRTGPTITPLVG